VRNIATIMMEEKDNLNIHEYAFIKPDQVTFSNEIRCLCERNACGMYGKSWACPPAVGSVEHCRETCNNFMNAFLFTSLAQLKDEYSVDEWLDARVIHENITERVTQVFRAEFGNVLTLSAEGCTVCKTCTYPERPCRFPMRMYPATEGYGIQVMQLAIDTNVKYNNGAKNLTYFSILFF
jgi:predicted metal-binding protein